MREVIHTIFHGRTGVLATMHEKEKVIAPILERELGIKLMVPTNLNTDNFGTFTREVIRTGNQLEAARLKAKEGLQLTGEKLGFSSEGSFGPHPAIPIAAVNVELVLLIDLENDLEIVGESTSFETNFGHRRINSFEEAYEFAVGAGFPEHGMVVRSSETTEKEEEIIKGITTKKGLKEAVRLMLNQFPFNQAFIEADMRAMYNPTRMKQIEKATHDLIKNINNVCPNCATPGFKLTDQKKGLPCMDCGFPTDLVRSHIYTCRKCGETEEKLFPHGKEKADPSQCMFCNP
ncbi:ribosomal protein S27AE [Evansella vedderi]|uniref:Ribosomal protein S27AE n=1 Tax=Evansella vedderi TaxID=38282 RepID=A0ABT9ZWV4_9BACI|nr:DUF6671 family protein [Evansella vedderi]MDQ0255712.1 ribosomal protein S27AE [Evansella vedderi]